MNSNLLNLSCQQVKSNQQKSCDGCKAHHIKCDRNVDGCKNCFKRGIYCTYLVKSKRRGPKTKVEHFMRYYESLNKNNKSKASGIIINREDTKDTSIERTYYNSQYRINTNPTMLSSANFGQSLVSNDSILYQTGSDIFPLYQNIYNPMLDMSCYNIPLSLGLNTVTGASLITPNTIATTNSIIYESSSVWPSLNQSNLQSSPILNQNTCPMYFD